MPLNLRHGKFSQCRHAILHSTVWAVIVRLTNAPLGAGGALIEQLLSAVQYTTVLLR